MSARRRMLQAPPGGVGATVEEYRARRGTPRSFSYTPVPVPASLFARLGQKPGNVFANYLRLQHKHPEFSEHPSDVQKHVEYVLQSPTDYFEGAKASHKLIVRRDGNNKVTIIDFENKHGQYIIRSAYITQDVNIQAKQKRQGGASEFISLTAAKADPLNLALNPKISSVITYQIHRSRSGIRPLNEFVSTVLERK